MPAPAKPAATIEVFRDDDETWAVFLKATAIKGFDGAAARMGCRTLPESLAAIETLAGRPIPWRIGTRCVTATVTDAENCIRLLGWAINRIGEDCNEQS